MAIKIEQSVVIDQPVEIVFALMAEPESWGWLHPVPRANGQISLDQIDVGTAFRPTLNIQGQDVNLLCEVTDYKSNELLSLACVRENVWLMVDVVFEPVGGGTRLTFKGEGNMRGFFNTLIEPLVGQEINTQVKASLEKLKDVLESSPPRGA
jgi:hypothetical protein